MKLAELEHVLRAASTIADDDEIVVVGSQAILGQFPKAPAALLASVEVDVYPKNHPERWELIDGSLGELSAFHDTFGYYAQGVEPGTAVLPNGFEQRWIVLTNDNTRGARGLCLEVHDLLLSKYVAFRAKDRAFAKVALSCGLAQPKELLRRLDELPVMDSQRERIAQAIAVDSR